MNLSKKPAAASPSSAWVCWIFHLCVLFSLHSAIQGWPLKVAHGKSAFLYIYHVHACFAALTKSMHGDLDGNGNQCFFVLAGLSVGSWEWASVLLGPPGRVASTIRPTRDQSHIDVLCEHELMGFMLTCKHSPSRSCWECWDLCLYVLVASVHGGRGATHETGHFNCRRRHVLL